MAVWLRLKSGANCPGNARRRAGIGSWPSVTALASVSTAVMANVRPEVSGAACLDGCAGKRTPLTVLASVSTAVMGNVRPEVSGAACLDGCAGKRTPEAAG
jgi:hypothetical protein